MKATSNLNDRVWVRLTDAGQEVLRAYFSKFTHTQDPQDYLVHHNFSDGWSTFQLHELMNIFGEEMYNGNPKVMFEQNLIHYTDPLEP